MREVRAEKDRGVSGFAGGVASAAQGGDRATVHVAWSVQEFVRWCSATGEVDGTNDWRKKASGRAVTS
jgi:hypothetical protein